MKEVKDVTALVVDNGLFISVAERLARDFKKVYYCVPGWVSSFPKMNQAFIGYGTSVEPVLDVFGPHFDSVDLFVFPDVYFGPLQLHLESLGKTVWGARMGEEMELERDAMKRAMEKDGLPVGGWKSIKGMAALREHLKKTKDQWVKVSRWRGSFETFFAKDYKCIEPKLDEVEYNLGAFKHIIEFTVEDDLPDKVEIGTDGYTIDGQFPESVLSGIEVKDTGYIGVFKKRSELPEVMTSFEHWASGLFRGYGYRGAYSVELRIGKDKKPYMIDFCARFPAPPNELQQEFYTNLPEIIWQGANNILVDPVPIAKYGAEAIIHSTWAEHNWQEVSFPEKFQNNVKLRNSMRVNGRNYVIPQAAGLCEIGAVVGWGDSIEAAMKMVKDVADKVEGYYLDVKIGSFEAAQKEIDKLEKFGASPF